MHLYGSSKTNKRDTSLIPLHCVLILDDSECCSRRHTPTMALGGWVATFPFVFLTLKHNKLNLHRLVRQMIALPDDTMLIGYDGVWRRMRSFDPPSLIRQVRFRYFLTSQRVTGIDAGSSQNASAMCKLVNFSNLMKKRVSAWPIECHNSLYFSQTSWRYNCFIQISAEKE